MNESHEIFAVLNDLRERVVRIETKMDEIPRCTDPTACGRLERGMDSNSTRLTALELIEQRRTGYLAGVAGVFALIGAGISFVLSYLHK